MGESWRKPGSIGLICGSVFTTALVEKSTGVGTTSRRLMDPDGDDNLAEDQSEAFESLRRLFTSIWSSMLIAEVASMGPHPKLLKSDAAHPLSGKFHMQMSCVHQDSSVLLLLDK